MTVLGGLVSATLLDAVLAPILFLALGRLRAGQVGGLKPAELYCPRRRHHEARHHRARPCPNAARRRPRAGHSHSQKGPNGGELVDVAGGHAEFVDTPTEIALHLSDEDGRPIPAKGATGKATILSGGKAEAVDLAPIVGAKLAGALTKPLASGGKVVVSARTVDGRKIQVRHAER